jgi:flagellar biosynthesis protein FlhA
MESLIRRIREKGDFLVTIGVVFVILIMIVPLTSFLVDVFITMSISLSLLILFIAMYIQRPLDFSVYPSILLITTLFRLSLNVATTRLILLHGDEGTNAAGRIIKAFGTFIIGGNYIVGTVVFLILVVINFVVITKGAGRVAEVAARFTLDAMPGKQMSIDADLNAGLIDEKEARRRREQIELEADFYGAMDGASKFVRGDAIAGIVILFVNIIGGLFVGVVQKGMGISEALHVYTILTIGDGLVSQIPALLTSTGAGIIVTRAAGEKNLGTDVISQVFSQPRALTLASLIILAIGFIPGIPLIPFLLLSSFVFGTSYFMGKIMEEEKVTEPEPQKEKTEFVQPVEILEIEIGYGLIPLVDHEQGGELLEKIRAIRKQMAQELGIVVPPMKLRDNLQLKPHEYVIFLKGVEVGRGELLAGHLLLMGPEKEKVEEGIPTKEPVFGLDCFWIRERDREKYASRGFVVVDHATIVATHLTELIRTNAHELLTRQETQKLLETVSSTHQKLTEELNSNQVTTGFIQKVLQNLLREQVSIRDLVSILEAIADCAITTKDVEVVTEFVRQRMAKAIIKPYLVNNVLNVLIFERKVEERLIEGAKATPDGLGIDLLYASRLIERITEKAKRLMAENLQPVLLVHPSIRLRLKRFIDKYVQGIAVISHSEIPPNIKIQSAGVIEVDEG